MAIRQADLEPLALSASGRARMVYGWAAASEDKRIDFSERSPGLVAYSKKGTARRDRAPFGLCQFGCRCQTVVSGEASALDLTPLVAAGWRCAGRENGGQ